MLEVSMTQILAYITKFCNFMTQNISYRKYFLIDGTLYTSVSTWDYIGYVWSVYSLGASYAFFGSSLFRTACKWEKKIIDIIPHREMGIWPLNSGHTVSCTDNDHLVGPEVEISSPTWTYSAYQNWGHQWCSCSQNKLKGNKNQF